MLFAAADKAMLSGLDSLDCTLCLDSINKFVGTDGKAIHFARLLRRADERSETLSKLMWPLVQEFCQAKETPLIEIGPMTKFA
jgi:hypothetical protein